MSKLQHDQQGFSAVEASLIFVIIAVIGSVGWYVWHTKQTTDKLLTTTTSANPVFKKRVAPTTPNPVATTATPSADVFRLTALGVELTNVPPSLRDLTVSKVSGDGTNMGVMFSTASLTKADPACSADIGTSIGGLSRVKGTYNSGEPLFSANFVKQFTGFWVSYSHPQAVCSNIVAAESLHVSQTAAFQALTTNPANLKLIQ